MLEFEECLSYNPSQKATRVRLHGVECGGILYDPLLKEAKVEGVFKYLIDTSKVTAEHEDLAYRALRGLWYELGPVVQVRRLVMCQRILICNKILEKILR